MMPKHPPGLILRGIDFGTVLDASGVRNFDGKGWWYHHFARPFGLTFRSATFVAKTTTLNPRLKPPKEGIMPMKSDGITPKELFPKCIYVNRRTKAAVNAVGLSGPGFHHLLNLNIWQQMTEPFFISLASTQADPAIAASEIYEMANALEAHKAEFKVPFGIQINWSCPNTETVTGKKVEEGEALLSAASPFTGPKMIKLAPGTPIPIAIRLSQHPECDGICVFNTLPWDQASKEIRMAYFGTLESPLKKRGIPVNGGISGLPLFEMTLHWVLEARSRGLTKPINAGGGILTPHQAQVMLEAGAESIFLGSIAFLNPTKVRATIDHANKYRIRVEAWNKKPASHTLSSAKVTA